MTFSAYIKAMTEDELCSYAEKCGTTGAYIKTHLLPARKIPKKNLMNALVAFSDGNITDKDVFDHFYGEKMPTSHVA